MRIDLQVTDEKTDKALTRLEKALERLEKVQKGLTDAINQTAAAADRASGAFGRMAGSASRAKRASQSVVPPPVTDWAQFRQAAAARMASDPTDQSALRDYNRATKRLNAQTPESKLKRALMRSRWTNVMGRLVGHPLGIDVMGLAEEFGPGIGAKLFGGVQAGSAPAGAATSMGSVEPAAALARFSGPLLIAATAVVAFSAALKMAHASMTDSARQGVLSGDYGAKFGFGAVVKGVTGEDVGGASRRIQSGLETPWGMAYAARLGVNPIGGPMGDIDYARKLQRVASDIAGSRSIGQARRKAEMVGMPELANLQLLNPSNKRYLAERMSQDPRQFGAALDASVSWQRMIAALERMVVVAAPAMEMLAQDIENMVSLGRTAGSVGGLALGANPVTAPLKLLWDLLAPKGQRDSATDANTRALDANTRALREYRETLGGGERAQSALPSRLRGNQMDHERLAAARLGGLGV